MDKPERYPAICIIESSGKRFLYPNVADAEELCGCADLMSGVHKVDSVYDADGLVVEFNILSNDSGMGRRMRKTPRKRKKTPDRPIVSKTPKPIPTMPTHKRIRDSDPRRTAHGKRAISQDPLCKPGRAKLPVEDKHKDIFNLLVENAGKEISDETIYQIEDKDLLYSIVDGLVATTIPHDGKPANESIDRSWLLDLKHKVQTSTETKRKKDFDELLKMFNIDV